MDPRSGVHTEHGEPAAPDSHTNKHQHGVISQYFANVRQKFTLSITNKNSQNSDFLVN